VHILASLPAVEKLAFGCEHGTKEEFLATAKATLTEDKQFKAALKERMKDGTSYVRARNEALLAMNGDIDESLLTSPNNLLGTEYCRALLTEGKTIEPLPIPRMGGGYADTALFKDFSSATALRSALERDDGIARRTGMTRKTQKALKRNMPEFVYREHFLYRPLPYKEAALCALLRAKPDEIAACPDCSEGLENRLIAMTKTNPDYDEMLKKVVSKRYTLSRLKRILAQNLLGIRLKDVKDYLESPLYCKVLGVKKESAEEILAELSKSAYPVIVRKSDYSLLKKDAVSCFETDIRAGDLYAALSGAYANPYETLFL
ncbi:MAG: nucleotidyltransferase family protein, partial [Clostridia bacterium]|nr:nucleotidyltransferase family protein [Clostridia bacterium]